MSSLSDDELLSAYLDGELTAGERERVEQSLAERPESRLLLEELRSIKTSLERLPRARLEGDFAQQILRQAEKEMLTTGDRERDRSGSPRPEGLSWRRMRRPLIWASLTLAGGLLVMFLDRNRVPPPHAGLVAQAPRELGERGRGEIGAAGQPRNLPTSQSERAENEIVRLRRSEALPELRSEMGDERGAVPPPNEKLGRKAGSEESPAGTAGETKGQTLLVLCEVAPDADYDATFRKMLSKQHIEWREEPEVSQGEAFAYRPSGKRLAEAEQLVRDPKAELVLVEASEPQIEAVLADLDRDAEVFVNVDVKQESDSPQWRRLERFGRRPAASQRPGERGRAAEKNRFQALFVLRPIEAKKPEEDAKQ